MTPPGLPAQAGTPAGYGKSCTNCSRAKCKCILRPGGRTCERCHRLNKSCQPCTSSRKRVSKRDANALRTAQLEEKLDDLVSMLRATTTTNTQVPALVDPTPAPAMETTLGWASSHPALTPNAASRLDSLAAAATSYPSSAASNPGSVPAMSSASAASHDSHELYKLPETTVEEAETYLIKFRDWLENFPFMLLPKDVTAAHLRMHQPFLYICIMTVTSMSVPQQTILRNKISRELAQRVIVNQESNLDLLQGLITCLAWGMQLSGPGTKPFFIQYSQLAVSILYSLNLTRAPTEEQYFVFCLKFSGARPQQKLRSMEERRAILSTWFISSMLSAFIGKMDTLRWTPHMDDCLAVLARNKEHPNDERLVGLIRYQLVYEEAQALLVKDVVGGAEQTPTYIFKKGLVAKLQEISHSMPQSFATNPTSLVHWHSSEAQVHAVGLFDQTIPMKPRIEAMFCCLKSIRAWFDAFFSIPLTSIPGSPTWVFVQLSHVLMALYRLTTTEDPAWDKELVRGTMDLLNLIETTIERLKQVDQVYPMQCERNEDTFFYKAAKIVERIRNNLEPSLSSHLRAGMATPSSDSMASSSQRVPARASSQGAFDLPDSMFMDFGDMAWLDGLETSWAG